MVRCRVLAEIEVRYRSKHSCLLPASRVPNSCAPPSPESAPCARQKRRFTAFFPRRPCCTAPAAMRALAHSPPLCYFPLLVFFCLEKKFLTCTLDLRSSLTAFGRSARSKGPEPTVPKCLADAREVVRVAPARQKLSLRALCTLLRCLLIFFGRAVLRRFSAG